MEEKEKGFLSRLNHPLIYLFTAWIALGVVLTIVFKALDVEPVLSTAWAVPDFLILVTLLWWLMFKKTPDALPMLDVHKRLRDRRARVADALEKAQSALDAAEKIHKDYTERMNRIEQEIEELSAIMRKEGETERERIMEEAKLQIERIKNETQFTAKQEIRKAEDQLRREAVERAVAMAEDIIKRGISDQDRERLLEESLKKMQERQ